MKYIKIFLASSIVELGTERLSLSDFIRSLNDRYVRRNIYFELIICENISNSLYQARKQQEYNEKICECQYFYILFGQNIGKYTLEEFHVALNHFKQSGTPKIYTYFKKLSDDVTPSQAILDFIKHLDEELGHYYSVFSHIDAIKLNILLELSRDEQIGSTISLQDGYAHVNGDPLLSMAEIPIYRKNACLQQIIEERQELEEEYAELIAILALKPDSQLLKKKMENNTQKRNTLLERQHNIEKEVLSFYSTITQKQQLGENMNWRERKALEMANRGDYEGAKLILKDEQWSKELSLSEAVVANKLSDIKQYISGKRTLIQAIRATGITEAAEQEIIACYKDIVALAEKYTIEMHVLYEYASFLMHHNQHTAAISICERLNHYYAYTQANDEACAGNKYLLACMYYKTNDLSKAEQYHREALSIRAELCNSQRSDALSNYAANCNQFGYLLFRTNRLQDAQDFYSKSIEIFRKLAEQDSKYGTNLALAINNMGILQQQKKDYMSAKSYFSEALDLRRKIATSNTTSALGFLAMGCLNYAKMLTELGDHEVADAYYREAIALYADLCVRDSKFKIDHTIAQYYLATALEATDADEALRLHHSILSQRIELGKTNHEALKADIARSYFSIGKLTSLKDSAQGKSYLEKSYGLWQELYQQAPAKFAEEFSKVDAFMKTL